MSEFFYKEYLEDVGIQKGDIVDVASDMLSIRLYCMEHRLDFSEDQLLNTLMEMVGEEGTLMIRTFTWAYCRGITFDYRKSKSEVGILGNIALKRTEFERTQHPIYSWAVWGKHQRVLCDMENIFPFGINTPFQFQMDNYAKLLSIGNIGHVAFTQLHHAEKLVDVPTRYEKYYDTKYIDRNNDERNKKYTMYVRRLDVSLEVRKQLHEVVSEWEASGITREKKYCGCLQCLYTDIHDGVEYSIDDLKNNYGRKLYVVNGMDGFEGITKKEHYENEYKADEE